MKYLHKAFKAGKGQVVVVNFSEPTRVLLLDDRNFLKYSKTASFTYLGGDCSSSPRSFLLPKATKWHVVVEKGETKNYKNVTASVELLPVGADAPGMQTAPAPKKVSPASPEVAEGLDAILAD